ncbi:MAG TPA: outer membrane beta-barrel protein [Candidatus Eisenbacteria bacterium]|nr:outer membrane beta-barrel protein [Candidatus Eisenbacteria bacterium]
MKTFIRSMVVLAVLVSIPVVASAQVGLAKRLVTVGVGGGMSVPVSDAADAFNNGFNVQGFARLNVPKLPVMPRFDLNFSRLAIDESQIGIPGTQQIISGLANLQVSVLPLGPVRPYVVAGLGAYNLKTETEGVTPTSESKTHFGINGGAGVALHLGMINGFIEGRVDNVYTEEGAIDANQVQFVPVTFGLTF